MAEEIEAKPDPTQLYTTTLELANYYDSVRDIDKTVEYSFKLCNEDQSDIVGLTKIIYWCSLYKKYDRILELLKLIKGNDLKLERFKDIFLRENRMTIKNFLIRQYILLIKKKESDGTFKGSVYEYMQMLYSFMYDHDVYFILGELEKEGSR